MTLVLSANNTGSDIDFILRGRFYMYIMNNTDPRIHPWIPPCFIVPQSEKKFLFVFGDFTLILFLLLLELDLNQS